IIIWRDAPGPVLFRQTRIGKGGRPFEMWKFRTMVRGTSDDLHRDLVLPLGRSCAGNAPEHRIYKLTNDPRITRAGRWLRRTSLDELPQLFNVLRGEMSLVGPRPPVPSEVAVYAADDTRRRLVEPGVTGV